VTDAKAQILESEDAVAKLEKSLRQSQKDKQKHEQAWEQQTKALKRSTTESADLEMRLQGAEAVTKNLEEEAATYRTRMDRTLQQLEDTELGAAQASKAHEAQLTALQGQSTAQDEELWTLRTSLQAELATRTAVPNPNPNPNPNWKAELATRTAVAQELIEEQSQRHREAHRLQAQIAALTDTPPLIYVACLH
jgi:uncharacterized protein YgiM (DUF1202 family)